MEKFNNINDVLSFQGHRIITKRVEPYDVIESVKKYYNVTDYTFNGRNKFEIMEEFLNALRNSPKSSKSFGLYMKNVNKFYLAEIKDNKMNATSIELLHSLLISNEYGIDEISQIEQEGIIYSTDKDYAIECIDMGKAEASFIIL